MLKVVNSSRLETPQVETEQTPVVTTNFRANDFERVPQTDVVDFGGFEEEESSGSSKWLWGLGALAVLGGAFYLGRNGNLGKPIQKLLGGAKKVTCETEKELKKLVEEFKDKKISELTQEEKDKIIKVLNPGEDAELTAKIEEELSSLEDKKLSEAVDSLKEKFEPKDVKKPDNENPDEGAEETGSDKKTDDAKKESEPEKVEEKKNKKVEEESKPEKVEEKESKKVEEESKTEDVDTELNSDKKAKNRDKDSDDDTNIKKNKEKTSFFEKAINYCKSFFRGLKNLFKFNKN